MIDSDHTHTHTQFICFKNAGNQNGKCPSILQPEESNKISANQYSYYQYTQKETS